jgi:hypothetical protein
MKYETSLYKFYRVGDSVLQLNHLGLSERRLEEIPPVSQALVTAYYENTRGRFITKSVAFYANQRVEGVGIAQSDNKSLDLSLKSLDKKISELELKAGQDCWAV